MYDSPEAFISTLLFEFTLVKSFVHLLSHIFRFLLFLIKSTKLLKRKLPKVRLTSRQLKCLDV